MDWQPLDPRAKILFYLQAFSRLFWFGAPACLFGTGVLSSIAPTWIAITAGVAFGFSLLLLTLWMPALAHSRWAYALREEDLMIQRGIFVRHVTAIPRCRATCRHQTRAYRTVAEPISCPHTHRFGAAWRRRDPRAQSHALGIPARPTVGELT